MELRSPGLPAGLTWMETGLHAPAPVLIQRTDISAALYPVPGNRIDYFVSCLLSFPELSNNSAKPPAPFLSFFFGAVLLDGDSDNIPKRILCQHQKYKFLKNFRFFLFFFDFFLFLGLSSPFPWNHHGVPGTSRVFLRDSVQLNRRPRLTCHRAMEGAADVAGVMSGLFPCYPRFFCADSAQRNSRAEPPAAPDLP